MTNLTLKSDQYLRDLQNTLVGMKSKKGVQRYRAMVTKAQDMKRHFGNSIICTQLPREDKLSQIPFKWLWRHGLKESMTLDTRKEACALALTLPAVWAYTCHGAISLQTNTNTSTLFSIHTPEQRTEYCTMLSDSKAIRIYKDRFRGHIDKIIQELQPEFIPAPFCHYNSRSTEVIEALNIDLYGVDFDQDLYIIQVRRWSRGKRFNSSTKDYFLIGRNENGNAFCHSVEVSAFRNRKVYTMKEKVLAAQAWIFGVKFDKMAEVVRQGDMGFLCLNKALPKHPYTDRGKVIVVGSSHRIVAESILEDNKTGKIYALKPKMIHDKSQHETICCAGWAEILIGRRKETRRAAKNSKD